MWLVQNYFSFNLFLRTKTFCKMLSLIQCRQQLRKWFSIMCDNWYIAYIIRGFFFFFFSQIPVGTVLCLLYPWRWLTTRVHTGNVEQQAIWDAPDHTSFTSARTRNAEDFITDLSLIFPTTTKKNVRSA